MLEFKAAPKKKKDVPVNIYGARVLWKMPFQVLCRKRLSEITIFFPLVIYKDLHLRRFRLDITASKVTTTCVWHWSKVKFCNFPIVS